MTVAIVKEVSLSMHDSVVNRVYSEDKDESYKLRSYRSACDELGKQTAYMKLGFILSSIKKPRWLFRNSCLAEDRARGSIDGTMQSPQACMPYAPPNYI